jgi:hypothetical protein
MPMTGAIDSVCRVIWMATLIAISVPCIAQGTLDQIQIGRWYEIDARPVPPRLQTYLPRDLPGADEDCPSDSSRTTYGWTYVRLESGADRDVVVQVRNNCICSPTGNCDFRVLRNVAGKYVPVLESSGNVQMFRILSATKHSFHDIETSMHGSAFDSEITRWTFNGMNYEQACHYDRNYWYADGDDTPREHKVPRITRCQ